MYKMDYERLIMALWDEDLKEKLHETYYRLIPSMMSLVRNPDSVGIKAVRDQILGGDTLLSTVAKFIINVKNPNIRDLDRFIVEHAEILMERCDKILDQEEIIVQVKRRRLLG